MKSFESHSEVLRLTQDLISIESHIDAPGREAAMGRFLVSWFRGHSIDAELLPVEGERANVVARIPGGSGPSLMLNGHIDTVPAGDMTDAFVPSIRENELWGRGACDMKGAVAAMACAMAMTDKLNGDLLFTGTIGEETGSIGVKALVEAGVTTAYAIVGEPTSLRVGIAHKGACFIRISLTGRGAHGSCPEEGVNAVSYGSQIIRTLETELRAKLSKRTHALLGTSTVSVGRIVGGTQPNIVAEQCQIDVDRRTLPGEKQTVDEISQLVGDICNPIDGLTWQIEEMSETALVPHVALGTSRDAVLAQAAQATCKQMGLPHEPVGVTYWTDGGHLAACGVETVILGPGSIADAHGPNDRVQTADLLMAVDIYGDLIRRILRPA
jgi:succinyl-diaminopimelate desuccinylase